jgi:hypothetical protein
MIERITMNDPASMSIVMRKFNELIEASNRQDRVLAQLIHNGRGGIEQYLDPRDYQETMVAYKEDRTDG